MRKTPILATVIALSTLTLSGCTFYFRVVHVHTYDSSDTVAYFDGDWYEYCTACGAIGNIVSNTEGRTFLIDSEDALADAMNKSGNQLLESNITLTSTTTVSRRASVTLNLNGYDLYVNNGINVLGSLSIVSEGSQYEDSDEEDEDEEYEPIAVGDGTVHFSNSGITVGSDGSLETSEWVSFIASSGVDELVSVEGGSLSVYGVIDNDSEGGTVIAASGESSVVIQESAEIGASGTAIKLTDTAQCDVLGGTILSDNNGVVIVGTEPVVHNKLQPENLVQTLADCECGCDSCTCEECECTDCENGECDEECNCECCQEEEEEEIPEEDHIVFNFYSGELETVDGPAIITNKIVDKSEEETDASVVNIYDGEIISDNNIGISLNAESSTCNITGGYVCGDTAIEIKGGTLNVEDLGESKEHTYIEAQGIFNYDEESTTTSGVGIAIIYTGEDNINVNISSGTIVGGYDNEDTNEGPYAIYQISLVEPCECEEECSCGCTCDSCDCKTECECGCECEGECECDTGCSCEDDCDCDCDCEEGCECTDECECECGCEGDCTCGDDGECNCEDCENCECDCNCSEDCNCEDGCVDCECDCSEECTCDGECEEGCTCECEECGCQCGDECDCATSCECGCTCNAIPNYVHVSVTGGTFTGMIYSENLSEFIFEGSFVNDYAGYDLDATGYISSDTTKQMSGRYLIVTYVPPEEVEEG